MQYHWLNNTYLLTWKHSQYFLRQSVFLHLQPLLRWAVVSPSSEWWKAVGSLPLYICREILIGPPCNQAEMRRPGKSLIYLHSEFSHLREGWVVSAISAAAFTTTWLLVGEAVAVAIGWKGEKEQGKGVHRHVVHKTYTNETMTEIYWRKKCSVRLVSVRYM